MMASIDVPRQVAGEWVLQDDLSHLSGDPYFVACWFRVIGDEVLDEIRVSQMHSQTEYHVKAMTAPPRAVKDISRPSNERTLNSGFGTTEDNLDDALECAVQYMIETSSGDSK